MYELAKNQAEQSSELLSSFYQNKPDEKVKYIEDKGLDY